MDPLTGTLSALGAFAVGFIARPVGGAVFAHFGDRIGRKPMLVYSLLLMGAATVGMGLLPGYDTLGIWAPVLLVTLRFLQGFGVGGEWGGAALMAVEHAPEHRRGFYCSWPQVGVPLGLVLGTATFAALSAVLSDEQFLAWGWRVPFLASIVLIGVGMWIRLGVHESPVFQEAMDDRSANRMPVLEALRTYPKEILLAAGSFLSTNSTFYVGSVWLVSTSNVWLFILGGLVVQACRSAVYGPQSAFFAEQFSTRMRYSGSSLAYQIASILGGVAPLLCTALVAWTGSLYAVAGYVVVISLISMGCSYLMSETLRTGLRSGPAVSTAPGER